MSCLAEFLDTGLNRVEKVHPDSQSIIISICCDAKRSKSLEPHLWPQPIIIKLELQYITVVSQHENAFVHHIMPVNHHRNTVRSCKVNSLNAQHYVMVLL